MPTVVDHRTLYRLPWSMPDNAIAWLEPTRKCNLACDGCYHANVDEHKSLAEIAADLDVFEAARTTDGVSIAGGDPLTHPQIVDVVRLIARRGWKPILNTNGLALGPELLRDLRRAGLAGLTFHVDSRQGRPGWKGKSEQELNALRLELAELVARAGGIGCAFNATVYESNLDAVPDLVAWAGEHMDIVHVMVFILYRAAVLEGEYDYYLRGQPIDMRPLAYAYPSQPERTDLTTPEVVARIRERVPDFTPCAYLNGTARPDSLKWLLSMRFGRNGRTHGWVGPKTVELIQTAHHLWTGRYLAYARPAVTGSARSLLLLAPLDRRLRPAFARAFFDARQSFRRMHMQSIMIIQPVDFMPDGQQNMCDGCPDMTVWDGHLAWSCRLEECLHFGQFVDTVPRTRPAAPGAPGSAAL